jgi:hypothetical protein
MPAKNKKKHSYAFLHKKLTEIDDLIKKAFGQKSRKCYFCQNPTGGFNQNLTTVRIFGYSIKELDKIVNYAKAYGYEGSDADAEKKE